MNAKRYRELELSDSPKLTEQEVREGWRFCCEWDQMLIHPNMPEAEFCHCMREGK